MNSPATSRSFPGRACLLGEHCDWYGGASLAIPLPMFVQATAEIRDSGVSVSTLMDGTRRDARWEGPSVDPTGGPLRFVPAAMAALRSKGLDVPPLHLDVSSNLPTGRGFSSSAAFCLTVLDAMAKLIDHELEDEELAELAFHTEHDLLGVACGRLDQLACVANSPVFLAWSEGRAPLVPVIPGVPIVFVVAALDAPRDTRAILDALRQPLPAIDTAMHVFSHNAHLGKDALERGDAEGLGLAMAAAQTAYTQLLEPALPALHAPQLRAVVAQLNQMGSLGAKFSGAGGDGSVIGLFQHDQTARRAAKALADSGIATWVVSLG